MSIRIELRDLNLNGPQPLVKNVSLFLNRGQTYALVGPSGSGKSLTCMALLGELPPGISQPSGIVLLDGQPVLPQQLRGKVIATILQNPRSAFNPVYTMRSHIEETCDALNLKVYTPDMTEALSSVGLNNGIELLKRYPFQLSGGMLQRIMIAIALLSQAPLIIADEPTTDLDVIAQAQILDLLEELQQSRQLGLLLVTHDMGVVARLADQVLVMEKGQLVEQNDVIEIFKQPKHSTTQQLIFTHLSLYNLEQF